MLGRDSAPPTQRFPQATMFDVMLFSKKKYKRVTRSLVVWTQAHSVIFLKTTFMTGKKKALSQLEFALWNHKSFQSALIDVIFLRSASPNHPYFLLSIRPCLLSVCHQLVTEQKGKITELPYEIICSHRCSVYTKQPLTLPLLCVVFSLLTFHHLSVFSESFCNSSWHNVLSL